MLYRRFALLAGLTLVAACGENQIVPSGAERSVTDLVSEQTGFQATDVHCPSGVEAKVGVTFKCDFTGPEGPYTADMRVTKVDGEDVVFAIKTHPTGR